MGLHGRQLAGLLLVLVTSYLAVLSTPGEAAVSQWWVASGIGACVLAVSPRRHAFVLFLGIAGLTWAGNVLGGRGAGTGPWLGLGNAVEAYVIARLLTHNWTHPPRLHSWADLRRYFVAVAVGSAMPALMSVGLTLGLLDRSLSVISVWVFINHLGCNLVLMLLVTSRPPTPGVSRLEVLGHASLLVAAVSITYAPSNVQTVAFLMMPLAVWAGSRFPSRWAVLELIGLGGMITAFAQAGIGPFNVLSVDASLVSVLAGMQTFMALSVLIALVFATGLALERQRGIAMLARQVEVEMVTADALEREREANMRMQSMDRAKNELISTISHELRTPLTSIVGYVELLEDDADLDEQRRADLLSRVSRNADRLLTLAKDVLLIAAVDEREHVPDRKVIDLREVVLAAQDGVVVPAARHSDLTVDVEVPERVVHVFADAQELERVVFNFVGNAIKFSPGPGTIHVWLATGDEMARVSVQDSGLGIPREDQQRIFDRFYRTTAARDQAVPGTGLGLSIARSIAEAHGGSVGLRSEEGEGSTFWVDIPLAPEGPVQ